jgi:hypothetical protein
MKTLRGLLSNLISLIVLVAALFGFIFLVQQLKRAPAAPPPHWLHPRRKCPARKSSRPKILR